MDLKHLVSETLTAVNNLETPPELDSDCSNETVATITKDWDNYYSSLAKHVLVLKHKLTNIECTKDMFKLLNILKTYEDMVRTYKLVNPTPCGTESIGYQITYYSREELLSNIESIHDTTIYMSAIDIIQTLRDYNNNGWASLVGNLVQLESKIEKQKLNMLDLYTVK